MSKRKFGVSVSFGVTAEEDGTFTAFAAIADGETNYEPGFATRQAAADHNQVALENLRKAVGAIGAEVDVRWVQ